MSLIQKVDNVMVRLYAKLADGLGKIGIDILSVVQALLALTIICSATAALGQVVCDVISHGHPKSSSIPETLFHGFVVIFTFFICRASMFAHKDIERLKEDPTLLCSKLVCYRAALIARLFNMIPMIGQSLMGFALSLSTVVYICMGLIPHTFRAFIFSVSVFAVFIVPVTFVLASFALTYDRPRRHRKEKATSPLQTKMAFGV